MQRDLKELTQIFEPNDSCSDLVSLTSPLKHSKLGLFGCQLYSERNLRKVCVLFGSILLHQAVDRLHDLFNGQACKKSPPNLGCAAADEYQWEHCSERHAVLEKSLVMFEIQSYQDILQETKCSTQCLLHETTFQR